LFNAHSSIFQDPEPLTSIFQDPEPLTWTPPPGEVGSAIRRATLTKINLPVSWRNFAAALLSLRRPVSIIEPS
jgi:hypothetical protein